MKYWRYIVNKSRSPEEIARLSGNSHWSIRDAFSKDIKMGIVNITPKYINRYGPPKKYYILSKNGRILIKILKGDNKSEEKSEKYINSGCFRKRLA